MDERPRKRVRLHSPPAQSSLATRTNDDDLATALEVDHMILDYLVYQAINTCFAKAYLSPNDYEGDTSPIDRAMSAVDDFRTLFKTRYPDYKLDANSQFRQLLLQMVALFAQRFVRNNGTPSPASIIELRSRNYQRGQIWIESADRLATAPLSYEQFMLYSRDLRFTKEELAVHRARVLRTNSIDPTDVSAVKFYGTWKSLSLLDLLPAFMKLSANFRNLLNISINETWCELALEWILQACLEEYLVFRSPYGADVLDEAFAWGYKPRKEGDKEDIVNELFKDDESEREIPAWTEMRQRTLKKLFPPTVGVGELRKHIVALSEEYPMRRTVETITAYLKGLSKSIPEPVLVQLEKGKMDGMTEEQTKDFMKQCGVMTDVASLLERARA